MWIVEDCLQQTLLKIDTDTGNLIVNLDHRITLLVRETECMAKMKLPIPNVTMAVFLKRDYFMRIHDSLKVSIVKFYRNLSSLPTEIRFSSYNFLVFIGEFFESC